MFTTSAVLLPNMSFEDLAEQILAVTEALELVKNLKPAVDDSDDNISLKGSSWISNSSSKTHSRSKPVSDLPPLRDNQHPTVLCIWVNSYSLASYKSNLTRELMELIREKRQHARALELARINNSKNQE